jgi:addiction module HigA family antidote
MIPENRIPMHPGEILLEEFLKPADLTQVALAQHLGIPRQRINKIVWGKRGITPNTAWLFTQAYGTTPYFWLNLQMQHELALNKPRRQIDPLLMPSA